MTEQEFNRRMEIEAQIAVDRERAAAEKEREKELNDPSRRKKEIEAGTGGRSAVRRPVIGAGRRVGGVVTSSSSSSRPSSNGTGGSSGGSAVRRPNGPRKPGRVF